MSENLNILSNTPPISRRQAFSRLKNLCMKTTTAVSVHSYSTRKMKSNSKKGYFYIEKYENISQEKYEQRLREIFTSDGFSLTSRENKQRGSTIYLATNEFKDEIIVEFFPQWKVTITLHMSDAYQNNTLTQSLVQTLHHFPYTIVTTILWTVFMTWYASNVSPIQKYNYFVLLPMTMFTSLLLLLTLLIEDIAWAKTHQGYYRFQQTRSFTVVSKKWYILACFIGLLTAIPMSVIVGINHAIVFGLGMMIVYPIYCLILLPFFWLFLLPFLPKKDTLVRI